MGPGTIFPLVVTSGLVPIISSIKEPPFLVYYRRGGISGLTESLVVYSNGTGVYRSDVEESRGKVDGDTISALRTVLNSVSARGFSEVGPKPAAMDFVHHEVIYPGRGERFAWVDEWASEVELPREIRALTKLLDHVISKVRGLRWTNWEERSTAYLRVKAALDGIVARGGESLSLRVSVVCLSEFPITYLPPTPHSPDVDVRSEKGISIDSLKVEGRISDGRRRKLVPGKELKVEASVRVESDRRGLHWLSVYFPPGNPSLEVSLPLVVV